VEHHDRVVKEMIDVVEEMVDTKTVEMAEETDSAEAITVVAAMKTVWTEIGNVLSVTITISQEETSVTDAVYLVPEAAAVAEATVVAVMAEEILVEVVVEATEAVVMAEEILVKAVAEATEAVVMAEEILAEVTIDARDETVHQEEDLRVQDLDLLRERNLDMPTTVDRVKLGHRVTIEDKIEAIKWVQNTIT
jgi:hypothetical protein